MCGIFGVFSFDAEQSVDVEQARRQTDSLALRGSESGWVSLQDGTAFGFRRSPSSSSDPEPCWDSERRVLACIDGRIANATDLTRQLIGRGHQFQREGCHAEIVVQAFREWGESFVERLRGEFALMVFDRRRRALLLARDRFGVKPLYYHRDLRRLAFASEPRALLADPTLTRALDPESLVDFLSFGFVPGPRTLVQGLESVPEAHRLVAIGDRQVLRPYWTLAPGAADEQAPLAESLLTELRRAIRLRRTELAPAGLLSGGIESGLITALLCEESEGPVRTATAVFEGRGATAVVNARELARRYATDHFETTIVVSPQSAVERLLDSCDEPIGDPRAIDALYLTDAISKELPAALVGSGLRCAVNPRDPRPSSAPRERNRFAALSAKIRVRSAAQLLSSDLSYGLGDYESNKRHRVGSLAFRVAREKTNLLDCLSAQAGCELMAPGLDHRLFEIAIAAESPARLLSEAASRVWPDGFPGGGHAVFSSGYEPPPVGSWLRQDLRAWAEDAFFSQRGGSLGLFDSRKLRRVWYEHQLGWVEHGEALWRTFAVELWSRRVLKGVVSTEPPPRPATIAS